jgi:hypothetical protein
LLSSINMHLLVAGINKPRVCLASGSQFTSTSSSQSWRTEAWQYSVLAPFDRPRHWRNRLFQADNAQSLILPKIKETNYKSSSHSSLSPIPGSEGTTMREPWHCLAIHYFLLIPKSKERTTREPHTQLPHSFQETKERLSEWPTPALPTRTLSSWVIGSSLPYMNSQHNTTISFFHKQHTSEPRPSLYTTVFLSHLHLDLPELAILFNTLFQGQGNNLRDERAATPARPIWPVSTLLLLSPSS